jgi:metal-dependent amidase/aminoacylase/carboxypeptidase family protein
MPPNAGDLEELYKDVHHHPELSVQEQRTAGLAVERLSAAGFEVTAGVGRLHNPRFAPVVHPTLETGVEALVAAASAWLAA